VRQAERVSPDSRPQALFPGKILPGDRGPLFLNFFQGEITGKELDTETGYYYFGARYLDPKTSRWISVDPAMGDYVPSAPVNDEARKRNGNLPNGGVYNYINLHAFHYSNNNPIKYVDPNGKYIVSVAHWYNNFFQQDKPWGGNNLGNNSHASTLVEEGCAIVAGTRVINTIINELSGFSFEGYFLEDPGTINNDSRLVSSTGFIFSGIEDYFKGTPLNVSVTRGIGSDNIKSLLDKAAKSDVPYLVVVKIEGGSHTINLTSHNQKKGTFNAFDTSKHVNTPERNLSNISISKIDEIILIQVKKNQLEN